MGDKACTLIKVNKSTNQLNTHNARLSFNCVVELHTAKPSLTHTLDAHIAHALPREAVDEQAIVGARDGGEHIHRFAPRQQCQIVRELLVLHDAERLRGPTQRGESRRRRGGVGIRGGIGIVSGIGSRFGGSTGGVGGLA